MRTRRTGTGRWTTAGLLVAMLLPAACAGPAMPKPAAQEQPVAAGQVQPQPSSPASTRAPAITLTPAHGDRLYAIAMQGTGSLIPIDAVTGQRGQSLAPVAAAPDWSVLYFTKNSGGQTAILAIEIQDADTPFSLRSRAFDGDYRLPHGELGLSGGLSPNGQWVALEATSNPAASRPYRRTAGARSRFAVLDTAFQMAPGMVDLEGDFGFDALSNDGSTLYLTENLTNEEPPRYQVRAYDLATHTLSPNPVAVKSEDPVMVGYRLGTVSTRYGAWFLSLYYNREHGPFLHALNLAERYALCLDLPATGKEDADRSALWSMALSPDGNTLYAVNGALGLVAKVDVTSGTPPQIQATAQFDLQRTGNSGPFGRLARALQDWVAPVAEAKGLGLATAAISRDGKTLYASGDRGVLVIDTASLGLRTRFLTDWVTSTVTMSPDGTGIYVTSPTRQRIVRLDPTTGQIVAEVPNAEALIGVVRAQASR